MSVHALLAQLADVGIEVIPDGEDLVVRGTPGISLAPYTEQIRQYKPQLLAVLSTDQPEPPALIWMHVPRDEVEAAKPPDGWDGSLPETCGWRAICQALGPCRRHQTGGPCRIDGGS